MCGGDRYHYLSSVVGLIVNLSAFLCFLYLNIYGACIWSAAALVFSLANVQLNYLILRRRIADWHSVDTLQPIKDLSVFGGVLACAAMVWYLFCYLYYKEFTRPDGVYMIMNAVWTFMTMKWNIFLFFTAKRCLTAINEDQLSSPARPT